MSGTPEKLGKIKVSPTAIASIASHAVLQSYGIVGMASKNLLNGLTSRVVRDPNRGIDVHLDGEHVVIDIYVIIEHGTRISSVAASAINAVRFNVERAIGVSVDQINVYVQGLRVRDEE
jgi:uncharacterized alkaline shock family protein YloU